MKISGKRWLQSLAGFGGCNAGLYGWRIRFRSLIDQHLKLLQERLT